MFATAHNWCDGRCARCVLEPECPVARRQLEMRQARADRVAAADDPVAAEAQGSLLEDAHEQLAEALDELTAIANAEGWSEDDFEPPVRTVVEQRIQNLGVRLLEHIRDLDSPTLGDVVFGDALMVSSKTSRVSLYLGYPSSVDDNGFVEDAVPNMQLIEIVSARIGEVLDQAADVPAEGVAAARKILADLARTIEPLRAHVPAEALQHLARLIESKEAPSPFVVRG